MSKKVVFFFGIFWILFGFGGAVFCSEEAGPHEPSSLQTVAPATGVNAQGMLPDSKTSSEASPEGTPGVDSAIEMAQQEVRDPFEEQDIKIEAPVAEPSAPVNNMSVLQPAAPEIQVELQGIGFGAKKAYAIIGGEVFHVGDEKKGIKLLEVRRREVDILVSGGKVTVSLFSEQDLQKARDRAQWKGALGGQTPLFSSQKES